MAQDGQERRLWLLMILLALWLSAFVYSVLLLIRPESSSVLGPMGGFLGWQGVAGLFAFSTWGLGWSFPKRTGIRRISAVPFGMTLAVLVGVLAWAAISPR